MKNPKVGDLVSFKNAAGKVLGRVTLVEQGRHQPLADVETEHCVMFTVRAEDLRRLVPKRRERTYTEAQVGVAMMEVLEVGNLDVWPKVKRALREGSGR